MQWRQPALRQRRPAKWHQRQINRYLNSLGKLEHLAGRGWCGGGTRPAGRADHGILWPEGAIGRAAQLAGLLGGIIAVHALEQVTAATATMGVRAFGRGRPLGKYRGLIIRQNPFTERKAALLRRLSRGRLRAASGYYFHEGGRHLALRRLHRRATMARPAP